MKYLIESDSLENLSSHIEEWLEKMAEDSLYDGELEYLPTFKVKLIEEE